MPKFSLTHIPALFIGTAFIVGGALPFWSPERAIREYGLPDSRATAEATQAVFPIYGSRAQIHGLCIWIFYLQGKLDVVDTLLAVLVYAGIVDWYICWREGMPGLWRFAAGLTLFIWGTLGMTAKGGRR